VVELSWTSYAGTDHYNIYRSETSGGPYEFLASTAASPYPDNSGVTGHTYYYVVRPALANDVEMCQSNEVEATPICDPIIATCVPTRKCSNLVRYYRELGKISDCYGRMQTRIYIGDTASTQVAGPYRPGDVVRISKSATATVRPGTTPCVAAIITVKGQATVWAVDPFDNPGPVIIAP
jgi:hypothetical protein